MSQYDRFKEPSGKIENSELRKLKLFQRETPDAWIKSLPVYWSTSFKTLKIGHELQGGIYSTIKTHMVYTACITEHNFIHLQK
jgi:hypothetical protein